MSPLIDTASLMARQTIKLEAIKQKCEQLAKANGAKHAKKSLEFKFLSCF